MSSNSYYVTNNRFRWAHSCNILNLNQLVRMDKTKNNLSLKWCLYLNLFTEFEKFRKISELVDNPNFSTVRILRSPRNMPIVRILEIPFFVMKNGKFEVILGSMKFFSGIWLKMKYWQVLHFTVFTKRKNENCLGWLSENWDKNFNGRSWNFRFLKHSLET